MNRGAFCDENNIMGRSMRMNVSGAIVIAGVIGLLA
jgi:hypothetical protein